MGINKLLEELETMMSVADPIEEHDSETAKRFMDERHKVLLVLTGQETDMKAAKYVLHITRRIGAGIRILYIAQEVTENSSLREYLMKLKAKGIEFRVTRCARSIKETIFKFIEEEIKNDINFVVIDSQDLGIPSVTDQKVDMKHLERLRCPLVLVSETARN
jgi:predicted RNase H-related nuclease YkuK (DUF458 family)